MSKTTNKFIGIITPSEMNDLIRRMSKQYHMSNRWIIVSKTDDRWNIGAPLRTEPTDVKEYSFVFYSSFNLAIEWNFMYAIVPDSWMPPEPRKLTAKERQLRTLLDMPRTLMGNKRSYY